jgi:hypothetical protein
MVDLHGRLDTVRAWTGQDVSAAELILRCPWGKYSQAHGPLIGSEEEDPGFEIRSFRAAAWTVRMEPSGRCASGRHRLIGSAPRPFPSRGAEARLGKGCALYLTL